MEYKKDYFGFVYIWYDKLKKMFYVGSHYGNVNDNYICSNKYMKNSYIKRPKDFKRKIIKYLKSDSLQELHNLEQHYLNMIDDKELCLTENLLNKTTRYYNHKKNASGGNGHSNKNNHNIGGWNKGLTKYNNSAVRINGLANAKTYLLKTPENKMIKIKNLLEFCEENNLNYSSIYMTMIKNKELIHGKNKGWKLIKKIED